MGAKNSNHSLFVFFFLAFGSSICKLPLHENTTTTKIFYMFDYILFYFSIILEPKTQVVGEPDIFVDIGSMLNLSCVVSFTERPPIHVQWLHNGIEVSFRGPRNGVSVSKIHVLHMYVEMY